MAKVTMILNEREARSARTKIASIDAALESRNVLEPIIAGLPPEVVSYVTKALKNERTELWEILDAFETATKSKNFEKLREQTSEKPGLALIVARISKGMTQKDLARRLGIKEQQVQRYEAERYKTISLERYENIATLLGVKLSASSAPFSGREFLIEDIKPDEVKKILRHGRKNGWFSEDADENDLRRFIASNRIEYGSPSKLRTGLGVLDLGGDLLLHAWRARVTARAKTIIAKSKPQFDILNLTWLRTLVSLSVDENGPSKARELLLDHGIVLIAEPQIQGLALDGAAFIVDGVPVIGLTILRDKVDNFWFTLLHEVGHVVLHFNKGLGLGFFDRIDAEAVEQEEVEANNFASNLLIPEELWRRSPVRIARSATVIEKFAKQIGVNPAIVFGRIQKERGDYKTFSSKIGRNKVRKQLMSEP